MINNLINTFFEHNLINSNYIDAMNLIFQSYI